MIEQFKIDGRSLRGVQITVLKLVERMNKILSVDEDKYGYTMKCEEDELCEAYFNLRYMEALIGNFLERRKEQE